MKKSLTVTWYKNNYGSILQAFALQYTITKLGIYNDILDFRFSYLKKLEFLLNTNAWFKIIKDKISIKFIEIIFLKKREKEIKYIRFYDFYKNYLKISNPIFNNIELKKTNDKYDIFICGSDQIWNPSYYKKCQFLDFADTNKVKFSYAASIGTSNISKKHREKIINHISDFSFISVRENKAKELLQSYCNKEITVVCDPVFLVSKREWESIFNLKSNSNKKYLLCYFLGDNIEYWKIAKEISQELEIEIKTIPNTMLDYIRGVGIDKIVGPYEWLKLMYDATFVLTDSFHGTAFSIIFNKSFYVLKRFKDSDNKSQNSRIYNILNSAGLEDRIITDFKVNDINSNLNISTKKWKIVNKNIEYYKNFSENWLKNILNF